MKITDEMVEAAYGPIARISLALFGEGFIKSIIRDALRDALAVAPSPTEGTMYVEPSPAIPPHKSLNERVAGLEKEVIVIHDRNDSNIQIIQSRLAELHRKIDTHIHHNDNGFHTGTAIYPVEPAQPAAGGEDARFITGLLVEYGGGVRFGLARQDIQPVTAKSIGIPEGCDIGVRVTAGSGLREDEVRMTTHDGLAIKLTVHGLVPHREVVTVSDEDVEAAMEAYDSGPTNPGFRGEVRIILQAFADRLNGGAK